MYRGTPFEIDKEAYDRAVERNGGYLAGQDMQRYFTESQLCGYGIYGAQAYIDKETGKYMCMYSQGDSCD